MNGHLEKYARSSGTDQPTCNLKQQLPWGDFRTQRRRLFCWLWWSKPERRAVVAMALAQHPEGENWDYLVRSLNVLEDQTAEEVAKALQTVRVATDDPMAIRQLILLGVRVEAKEESFESVEGLLVV